MHVSAYIRIIRPTQWLKNLMIFFPPVLGGALQQIDSVTACLLPFIAFSALASSTYIINDISDLENDRLHPEKKGRPLPAGSVSKFSAIILATVLLISSFGISLLSPTSFYSYLALYFLISLLYSLNLKNVPILDLFCISSGFVIRLMAGGVIFSVTVSEWLYLSVLLLSLFLATGKRLGEKELLKEKAVYHRKVLALYPEGFLDGMLFLTGSAVLVTYSMYVVSRHSSLLLATVPLCCFGLMRYILRVKSGGSGDPTDALTRDIPLLITGILWAFMIGWGIFGG